MSPPTFALYFTSVYVFLCLAMATMAPVTALNQFSLRFKSANPGDNVTLQCLCHSNDIVMLHWYKQTLREKPKLVSTFYVHNKKGTFQEEFNNTRFSLNTKLEKNDMTISDLRISDSATYFCVMSNLMDFEFCDGTVVNIKGSGLKIQLGGSESLNCTVHTGTCDGKHSVHWFKNSEESHPGLIYTHGGKHDQCERKPDTQTHTCIYNLPMKNLTRSQTGTYSCAVATCGHILFGDRKMLGFKDEAESYALVYFLSGALALTTILGLSLAFTVYKLNKRLQCADSNATFSVTSTPNTELCQDGENLHYAALRDFKASTSRRNAESIEIECVYTRCKAGN